MAQASIQNGTRVYSLNSATGQVRVSVAPDLGGVVSSLVFPGPDGRPRECLYRHPWFWNPREFETRGGIPLLFPICGRLLKDGTPGRYHVEGAPHVLPIHGFAMRQPWEVVAADSPDALRLRLADSAPTRAAYPFAFELALMFSVADDGFTIQLTVTNASSAPMPYSAGFHPYFATPPPGAGKEQTRFEATPAARLIYNETKTDVLGTAPPPAFPKSCADDDVNGLLLDLGASDHTHLRFPDGFALRQTASPLFRYRQFYTLPDQPFFCDEPWMAPPGVLNRLDVAHLLPPGHTETSTLVMAPARD